MRLLLEPAPATDTKGAAAPATYPQDYVDALKGQIAEFTAELGKLKGRPSTKALEDEVAGLKGQIKERAYRDAFNDAAKAAGLNPKALDAAWKLAGLDQSADAPDAAKVKAAVEAFVADHDYLKAPTAGGADKPLQKGPDGGRGASAAADVAGKFEYSNANLSDGVWMTANGAKLTEALAGGRAVRVD